MPIQVLSASRRDRILERRLSQHRVLKRKLGQHRVLKCRACLEAIPEATSRTLGSPGLGTSRTLGVHKLHRPNFDLGFLQGSKAQGSTCGQASRRTQTARHILAAILRRKHLYPLPSGTESCRTAVKPVARHLHLSRGTESAFFQIRRSAGDDSPALYRAPHATGMSSSPRNLAASRRVSGISSSVIA